MIKRTFDVAVSLTGLLALSPILGLAALWIRLDSPGSVIYKQERVGKNFKRFVIYKFRTMREETGKGEQKLTVAQDSRITPAGRFLRRTKMDELPQLLNVLWGDMSLVGPRPELPRYVDLFRRDYEELLKVRPGITDPASLKYGDEQAILGLAADPEKEYLRKILPDKIGLSKEYVSKSNFIFDLKLIFQTLLAMFNTGTRRV